LILQDFRVHDVEGNRATIIIIEGMTKHLRPGPGMDPQSPRPDRMKIRPVSTYLTGTMAGTKPVTWGWPPPGFRYLSGIIRGSVPSCKGRMDNLRITIIAGKETQRRNGLTTTPPRCDDPEP
jgi:hypothetical protein